jgi:hypothetical protein
MKAKKVFIIIFSVILSVILLVIGLFNTSVGKDLVKSYFQKKIDNYFVNTRIVNLIIHFNTFSMFLEQNNVNEYKLYGQLFPFDSILEGKIEEFKIGNKVFDENISLSGNVKSKGSSYIVTARTFFDNYIGLLKIILKDNHKIVNFKTSNVDIDYFINKLNLRKVYNLSAKVNADLTYENNRYKIVSVINGVYKNKSFLSKLNFNFNTLDKVNLQGVIRGNLAKGVFEADIRNNKIFSYKANFNEFDLSLLDFIYPFRGKVKLSLKKDKAGIIRFVSDYFKGFMDNSLNLEFSIPINQFFYYLNLINPVFEKGKVTGRSTINNNKGSFNFIIQNVELKKSILDKLNLRNSFFDKIFVRGYFDENNIYFRLLTESKDITASIDKGVIGIKKPSVKFYLTINDLKHQIYYLYKIENNKIALIKKKSLKKKENKVLVF